MSIFDFSMFVPFSALYSFNSTDFLTTVHRPNLRTTDCLLELYVWLIRWLNGQSPLDLFVETNSRHLYCGAQCEDAAPGLKNYRTRMWKIKTNESQMSVEDLY